MEGFAFFIIAFLISYFITPKTLHMLHTGGLTKNNYRGNLITGSAGIVFPAVLALTYALAAIFFQVTQDVYIYLGFISLISFSIS